MNGRDSRWTLDSTGNRIGLAVLIGFLAGCLANQAGEGIGAAAWLLVIAAVGAVAYALITLLHRSRR